MKYLIALLLAASAFGAELKTSTVTGDLTVTGNLAVGGSVAYDDLTVKNIFADGDDLTISDFDVFSITDGLGNSIDFTAGLDDSALNISVDDFSLEATGAGNHTFTGAFQFLNDLAVPSLTVGETPLTESMVGLMTRGNLGSTDNRLVRTDGTGGRTLQSTGITIDDSENVSGVANLTTTGAATTLGGNSTSGTTLKINGAAGTTRSLIFQSGGVDRWAIQTTNAAETGSPTGTGSDFKILGYYDNGSAVATYLTMDRTGNISLKSGVSVLGGFGCTQLAVNGTTATATGISIMGAANAAAVRTTADAQQLDTELTALASTTSAANKIPYYTGSGTATTTDFSAAGRALANATGTADTYNYWSASNTTSNGTLTAGGRALLALVGVTDTVPVYTSSSATTTWALKSGSWTPTYSNITNVSGTPTGTGWYSRNGSEVECWGVTTSTFTTGGALSKIGMTLPIASNVNNDLYGAGALIFSTTREPAQVLPDNTNDIAEIRFYCATTSSHSVVWHFGYTIN